MSEELEEAVVGIEDFIEDEAPQPEEPAPVADEPAPAPEVPDAAAIAEKEAWVKKREAELEKGFRKIAERERALSAQPEPQPEGEPIQLTPEAKAVLKATFDELYGSKLSFVDTLAQDTIDAELEHFASAKGIEPEVLRETLAESGIQPKEFSRKGLREAFDTAYNIHSARTLDLDKLKNEWKEELLAEMKQQGIRVDSVESTGRVDLDEEPGDFMLDDDMDASAKYAAILKKMKL